MTVIAKVKETVYGKMQGKQKLGVIDRVCRIREQNQNPI
jgi:hypothetical protein